MAISLVSPSAPYWYQAVDTTSLYSITNYKQNKELCEVGEGIVQSTLGGTAMVGFFTRLIINTFFTAAIEGNNKNTPWTCFIVGFFCPDSTSVSSFLITSNPTFFSSQAKFVRRSELLPRPLVNQRPAHVNAHKSRPREQVLS